MSLTIAWLSNQTRFFQTLELKTLDFRFRLLGDQGVASSDIVLIEIDDPSIKNLEPEVGRWPWPRDVHAVFLEYMREAKARLVVFDLLFLEQDKQHPQGDQELAESTGGAGNVVHALYLGFSDTGSPDRELLEKHSMVSEAGEGDFIQADLPLTSIAMQAQGLGHVVAVLDSDGPWRRYLLLAGYQDRKVPSLSLAAAMALQGLGVESVRVSGDTVMVGSVKAPLDQNGRLRIWFNGGPGSYQRYGYSHVFYSQLQIQEGENPILDPELFADKIVLVGITAAGLHDLFTTPYSGSSGDGPGLGKMPGVEVHAQVLDDLLHNRYLRALSPTVNWILVLTAGVLVLFQVLYARIWIASVLVLATLTIYLACVYLSFEDRLQLPVMPVLICGSLGLVLGFAYQYWIEGAEKQKVKRIFSHYVSRDVFQELLSNPAAVELGGSRKMVTVLFSDLRNFTTMSEKMPPERLIAQLNEYFSAMVDIVFQHRGTVDKFVADMIMAIFNAPLDDPSHADNAVCCARAMTRKLKLMNQEWELQGRPTFQSGIGINSGEAILGNVGSETVRSYTVIGDAINLGARLESLCKEYSTEIIVSEFTLAMLEQKYPRQELGEVVVKGKTEPVRIYDLSIQSGPEEGAGAG